jgi:hypothetical protein
MLYWIQVVSSRQMDRFENFLKFPDKTLPSDPTARSGAASAKLHENRETFRERLPVSSQYGLGRSVTAVPA